MPNWDELLGKEATCACQYIICCRAFVFQMPSSAARTALQDLLSLNKFCGCFPNWPSFTEWLWSGLYRICPNNMQYEHRTNGQKLDRNTCFSRMCSKGSRFTLVEGVFARRCVHNRNRPQPFAGGRLRPVWPSLWRVLQKVVTLWRFPMPRSLVSRGRRGTSWQTNMFHNVLKIVWCGRCVVSRRWVAVLVAGVALWRPPSWFRMAGAAL